MKLNSKNIHIIVIVIGIIFMLLPAFHTNIWYDESYTVALVNHSFSEIWTIGANDVHPVLYYYIIKLLNLIFGTNILIYRLFSVVPVAILAILGYTHIRKDFGEKTGIIFSFLISFFPIMSRYATEIRMYSWAMLFITIAAIYAYRLYKERVTNKNLIIFGIFSLFGAYTHYYGLMASGLINLALFIYLVKNFKEKKVEFAKFMVCAVLQVALYIPWLLIFLSQFGSVSSNGFWITISFPNTLIEVLGIQCAGRILPKELAFAIMLVLYIYIGYLIYKSVKEKTQLKPGILALIIYFGVVFAAYIISKITTPILHDRYLLVVTGLITFFIAFFMAKEKKKWITIVILAIIGVASIVNMVGVMYMNYNSSNKEMLEYIDNNLQENDSFLMYSDEISGFALSVKHPGHMQYFHDNNNWGAGGAYESFGPDMYRSDNLTDIMEKAERKNMDYKYIRRKFQERDRRSL